MSGPCRGAWEKAYDRKLVPFPDDILPPLPALRVFEALEERADTIAELGQAIKGEPLMDDLPRRFILQRIADATGVSGTGRVMDGVVFGDGKVVTRWRTEAASCGVYDDIADFAKIHMIGHGEGSNKIVWVD